MVLSDETCIDGVITIRSGVTGFEGINTFSVYVHGRILCISVLISYGVSDSGIFGRDV